MIDSLYFLQFACFIFMLINALILGITHLHMKWINRRYEWSRWLILAGMTGLAIQYLLQMLLGFRAKSDNLGAIFNILVYTPCFTTISMGIYNIEATHANRRKMNIVCACIYAAIIAVFCIGYSNSGSLNIGYWLYAMLVLFGANVAYCIYMIMIEMRKRKKMLELMTGGDMLPYVRYARASVFALFFSALTMPFVILSTTLLYIIGPLALLSILFFNLSFVALFLLIFALVMSYAMVQDYRMYLDENYKARYSFCDFIKRERFYIYLLFASIFISLTNLLCFL